MWFAETRGNRIGRITPNGTITEYPLPSADSSPQDIAAGPDGNMWFTEPWGNQIGRITPDGTITEFPVLTAPTHYPGPWMIAAGPDGKMWFTGHEAFGIARITPDGTVNVLGIGGGGMAAGPDGNMWLTGMRSIRRIAPDGTITKYPLNSTGDTTGGIAAGPDGNMWFTGLRSIGRITPMGTITKYRLPTADSLPLGITGGPDGNMWFTERQANKIGRISPKAKGTPLIVKRACPVHVTPHTPAPARIGSRIFTDRISTKRSVCALRRPVVRVQLAYYTSGAKPPVFDTKTTKRGKIRVITKGREELTVTVIVRAQPKRGFADRWKRGTWREMWYLR